MARTQGFHPCNTGSIPVGASNYLDVAQFGRALGLGPRGQRFESFYPDQWFIRIMVSISDCLSEDRGSILL